MQVFLSPGATLCQFVAWDSGRHMINTETKLFGIEVLREFSTRVFLHFGCSKEDAEQAADVLACADLRGIDSHGVARLHCYFELLSAGAINPNSETRPSTMDLKLFHSKCAEIG